MRSIKAGSYPLRCLFCSDWVKSVAANITNKAFSQTPSFLRLVMRMKQNPELMKMFSVAVYEPKKILRFLLRVWDQA
jgi:hypothetical protein